MIMPRIVILSESLISAPEILIGDNSNETPGGLGTSVLQ